MPSSRVHVLAGATLFVPLYALITCTNITLPFSLPERLFLLGLTLTGAIFPDIDIKSNMQNTFYKSLLFILPVALFVNRSLFIGLLAIAATLKVIKHRGITHNPLFLLAAPAAITIGCIYRSPEHATFLMISCLCFTCGALSHIILDRTKTYFLYKK
jgi:membrane-bound metal-dependent hydrolase YbcI (DUF457 family)